MFSELSTVLKKCLMSQQEMKARTGDQVSSAILGIMDAVKKEDSSPSYSSSDEISETGGDYIVSETASDTMATHILKVMCCISVIYI